MSAAQTAIAALLVAGSMFASSPTKAQPRHYQLDPVHTRVIVSIDHAGFSRAVGTISGATGSLAFDPDDPNSAHVDVEIPVGNLDFGDAEWNSAVLARTFLDADRYPTARFASTSVELADDGDLSVHGDLLLRGITSPITLHTRINAIKRYPLPPFRRTAGFSATTRLDRTTFGMTAWSSLIGIEVTVQLEVEAWQVRHNPDEDPEEENPPTSEDREADES